MNKQSIVRKQKLIKKIGKGIHWKGKAKKGTLKAEELEKRHSKAMI